MASLALWHVKAWLAPLHDKELAGLQSGFLNLTHGCECSHFCVF